MTRVSVAAVVLWFGGSSALLLLSGMFASMFPGLKVASSDFEVLILAGIFTSIGAPLALISIIVGTRLHRRRIDGWIGGICIFGASLSCLLPLGALVGAFGLWALLSEAGRKEFGVNIVPHSKAG